MLSMDSFINSMMSDETEKEEIIDEIHMLI